MSDNEDQMMAAVTHRLTVTYISLFTVCENLPIPIALPQEGAAAELMAAVSRVCELAEQQPIPEEQQAQLFTGALMWHAAADIYSILRVDFSYTRADGAFAVLMVARDALIALGTWLVDQP